MVFRYLCTLGNVVVVFGLLFYFLLLAKVFSYDVDIIIFSYILGDMNLFIHRYMKTTLPRVLRRLFPLCYDTFHNFEYLSTPYSNIV